MPAPSSRAPAGRRRNDRTVRHANGEVGALSGRAPNALEPALAVDWREAADDAGRLRGVVDRGVASRTDASATGWHRRA